MALFYVDLFSETLGIGTSVNVYLPVAEQAAKSEVWDGTTRLPVLWLLHPMGQDHNSWLRYTSLNRYLVEKQLPLAVVMPFCPNSRYTDQQYGLDYYTYLVDELPDVLGCMFPLSKKREDSFIAGASMGGHGAMKAGINRPERYSVVGSFSGSLNRSVSGGLINEQVLLEKGLTPAEIATQYGSLLGERAKSFLDFYGSVEQFHSGSDNLTRVLTEQAALGKNLPQMFLCCGTEDPLLSQTTSFCTQLDQLGLPYTVSLSAGAHDFAFWDNQLPAFLDFIAGYLHA